MISKSLKLLKIVFIVFVVSVFFIIILSQGSTYDKSELSYGVTFSKKHALSLELDWQDLFTNILDDLKVKRLRIPAYWDEVEKINGQYDYADLDWQIEEAAKRNAQIVLAVGGRLPRWPECHLPEWTHDLEKEVRENETFEYITKTIERYKDYPNIFAWQIENEFFLTKFGECPNFGTKFLDAEIELVKKLAPHGSFNSQHDCIFLKKEVSKDEEDKIRLIKNIYQL